MDERIVKKKLPEAADDFAREVPGVTALVLQDGPIAQIIDLDSAKNRMRAHTSNDPPNVPIDEHIGRHLKAIYDDVLNQPIPDRFLDLLTQLSGETSLDGDA